MDWTRVETDVVYRVILLSRRHFRRGIWILYYENEKGEKFSVSEPPRSMVWSILSHYKNRLGRKSIYFLRKIHYGVGMYDLTYRWDAFSKDWHVQNGDPLPAAYEIR